MRFAWLMSLLFVLGSCNPANQSSEFSSLFHTPPPVDTEAVRNPPPRVNTLATSAPLASPIPNSTQPAIDTPRGAVPVQNLRKGMLVWTATRSGKRELAVILQTVRRPVPSGVLVVHLVLDNGRELFVSAGHQTIDGRRIGDLVPGDILDGARVRTVREELFTEDATYHILPAGETGAYWANGILLGGTLSIKRAATAGSLPQASQ